jgi:DnaJ-class molecular chaperone|tara:strand:- start:76 stop:267 length:192 start_codon:yes stop_codon:yes gene_type:complete
MKLHTFKIVRPCPECHGEGDEGSEEVPCGFCGGIGYLSTIKRYKTLANAKKENPFPSVITDGS